MKIQKSYLLLSLTADLLGIVLVVLSMFLYTMPEYVVLLLIAVMVVFLALYCKKGGGRWLPRTTLIVLFVFSACLMLFGSFCNPYFGSTNFRRTAAATADARETLSCEEAKKDIDVFMHYLKKDHPAFSDEVPGEVKIAYEKAVRELEAAESIDVSFLQRQIQHIASVLKDGHTTAYPIWQDYHYLKYIQAMKYKEYSLLAINGIDIKELFSQKQELYSYEVESWGIYQLAQHLQTAEGLYFLELLKPEGVSYTFGDDEGHTETIICHEEDFVTLEEYWEINKREEKEEKAFVYYDIYPEKSLALLTLNQCNYNEEYRSCVKELFAEVKKQGIENVAVDLRDNGGGNSMVANEFIRYLDVNTYYTDTATWRWGIFHLPSGDGRVENDRVEELIFDGNVYVLTADGSFSAAMMFAEYIKDNKLGTIIGEAPGNAPTGYGDIAVFRLPHSGLYVQISTKQFYRADKETEDLLVTPDVPCDADEALEYLFEKVLR